MLKEAKQQLLKSVKFLGIFDDIVKSNWRKNKLLILGYHGISIEDEHLWNSSLFMPADLLRRRFELIKKYNCNVLRLAEAIKRLYENSLPERSVVITFDDGLYDFYKQALPIIKEFSFPVTLYLTTFYSQYNRPVFGVAVDYLLWKSKKNTLRCEQIINRQEQISIKSEGGRGRAHSLIITYANDNKISAEQKDSLLEVLCDELDLDYSEFCSSRFFQLMNLNEVASLSKSDVDVELHTHRHRVPLDEKLFKRELEDNRKVIEATTLKKTKHFCYPSGEYHPKFFPWLKAAGVVSATTCDAALSTSNTNPLLLPRLVDTCSLSEVEFEGWLAGASHFLPQRRNT